MLPRRVVVGITALVSVRNNCLHNRHLGHIPDFVLCSCMDTEVGSCRAHVLAPICVAFDVQKVAYVQTGVRVLGHNYYG